MAAVLSVQLLYLLLRLVPFMLYAIVYHVISSAIWSYLACSCKYGVQLLVLYAGTSKLVKATLVKGAMCNLD